MGSPFAMLLNMHVAVAYSFLLNAVLLLHRNSFGHGNAAILLFYNSHTTSGVYVAVRYNSSAPNVPLQLRRACKTDTFGMPMPIHNRV